MQEVHWESDPGRQAGKDVGGQPQPVPARSSAWRILSYLVQQQWALVRCARESLVEECPAGLPIECQGSWSPEAAPSGRQQCPGHTTETER